MSFRISFAWGDTCSRRRIIASCLFGLMRLGWVERQILLPFAQLQERVADQLTGVQTDAVYVDASCSGGDAMALCLGAVLACPATWSARLRRAGVGPRSSGQIKASCMRLIAAGDAKT